MLKILLCVVRGVVSKVVDVWIVIISEVDNRLFSVVVSNGTVTVEIAAVAMLGMLLLVVILSKALLLIMSDVLRETNGLVVESVVLVSTSAVVAGSGVTTVVWIVVGSLVDVSVAPSKEVVGVIVVDSMFDNVSVVCSFVYANSVLIVNKGVVVVSRNETAAVDALSGKVVETTVA